MTVYNTAYETTACVNFAPAMKKAADAIAEARLRDWIPSADGLLLIASSKGPQSVIPQFNHAYYIGEHGVEHLRGSAESQLAAYLAVDIRSAGRTEVEPGSGGIIGNGKFKVVNDSIYKSRMYRAGLTALWLTQGANVMRSVAAIALPIYANWLAESISFRFQLDPKSRYDLVIMAALFYMSNHVNGLELDKAQESRYLAWVATGLKFDIKDVTTIYNRTKLITSMSDFCAKAIEVTGNIRLKDLNHGLLTAIVGGTWFGDNAKENLAVALEHPPTWIGIVLEAYTNKVMRKATIATICERRQYKDGLDNLVRNIKNELKGLFDKIDNPDSW